MRITTRRGRRARSLFILLLIVSALVGAFIIYRATISRPGATLEPLAEIRTLAGASSPSGAVRFRDPFGVVVAADRMIYLTDGESGRLWQIAPDGAAKVIAENLDVPSAVALAPDGTLVIAETGGHTIKRVEPQSGSIKTIAGVDHRSGWADGRGAEALFNGPVGVAVSGDGTIFVADTYNDRIRSIDTGGFVRTLAGGDGPGYADAATGVDARFDTPCGIAVAPDASLVIADTGNRRLRRIGVDGAVTTIAGTGEPRILDGAPLTAAFVEPVSVAVDLSGTIYVADAGGSALRVCNFGVLPLVVTLAGGEAVGLVDGVLRDARLNRLSGIAISPDATLVVADTGNGLVRAVVPSGSQRGALLARDAARAMIPSAAALRAQSPPRWPYDPPERPREIAATFGEIRGEMAPGKQAWFHSGLDIPGAYGETVHAIRDERLLRPLAVEGVGTARERIRFPTLGYIHLRIGRDSSDRAFNDERFALRRDENGRVTGVRVRRGTRFAAGDALGTLNDQYHVHLVAGPAGAELNALAALELPGVRDTVAPTIEKDGVSLFDRSGQEFREASLAKEAKRAGAASERITVRGDVRIVVRAYDQMDGNAARRRLGLYRLGYQVLDAGGTPAHGFAQPLTTISFESLPDEGASVPLAYAAGSKAGYTRETVFAYIVTNLVRDRAAAEDFWHTASLAPGDYILRVFVEDFFGNRTTHDTPVRIAAPAGPIG